MVKAEIKKVLISESAYLLTCVTGAFPASCFCVRPVLRLFQDSSGGPVSHTKDQKTGGSQSLALFRLTAGVIRLLTHWVDAPFQRRESQDSSFSVCVPETEVKFCY